MHDKIELPKPQTYAKTSLPEQTGRIAKSGSRYTDGNKSKHRRARFWIFWRHQGVQLTPDVASTRGYTVVDQESTRRLPCQAEGMSQTISQMTSSDNVQPFVEISLQRGVFVNIYFPLIVPHLRRCTFRWTFLTTPTEVRTLSDRLIPNPPRRPTCLSRRLSVFFDLFRTA